MSQPSLPLVNMAGVIISTLVYGMYFIIFTTSMYLVFARATRERGSSSKYPVFGSVVFLSGCALWIAVTGAWIVTVVRAFRGFIFFHDGMGASIYFNNNADITETMGDGFLAASLVIGDSMIIYRLWVVWSFNMKIIVLPIMTLLGLFISLVITVHATIHLESIALDTGLTPITVFTLVTNLYCTALIAWEIWRISRNCQPVGGMDLREFLAIVVESAALYSCYILYYTISHQLNSTLQYIAVGSIPPVIGLANGLIHVRVGLGQTIEQLNKASNASSTVATAPIRFVTGSAGTGSGEESAIKMSDI
ncbi:hypothetical protein C8R44DRAFT_760001 [Mycena epipterygia]|nr:hypothetical protein C8R44DRAFT_760001 [Mycena epipterygia]